MGELMDPDVAVVVQPTDVAGLRVDRHQHLALEVVGPCVVTYRFPDVPLLPVDELRDRELVEVLHS
jgi:hypothetical protein